MYTFVHWSKVSFLCFWRKGKGLIKKFLHKKRRESSWQRNIRALLIFNRYFLTRLHGKMAWRKKGRKFFLFDWYFLPMGFHTFSVQGATCLKPKNCNAFCVLFGLHTSSMRTSSALKSKQFLGFRSLSLKLWIYVGARRKASCILDVCCLLYNTASSANSELSNHVYLCTLKVSPCSSFSFPKFSALIFNHSPFP